MAMMSSIVLVPNSIVANQIRSAVGEKTRIELRGGIDYNDIVGLPEEERIFDACFLGRLHPTKGISDLIRVWRQIILEKKDARLAIVGGGPLTTVRRLENDIEQGHLEHNVVFFGETAHEVALRVLKKCKVLIHPSYEEGFSIAICEALACGLPVIAYDLPIYREIYGDLVLLVPTGDVTALAREALGLILNEERRLSLAREGVKQAQEYDWDHVANRISRVMHESLNKCPHARP
jgi:glycosyltransferase involved in cell wall biosynthesis